MERYSLFELNEFIRRIFALNFADPVWVHCEIAQLSHSRGHYFLSLVQKDPTGENILAQSEAVIWKRTYRRLRRQMGKETDALLQSGMAVQLSVRVVFHERYGLRLHIEDLDPEYTLGEFEQRRRRILERLVAEGLTEKNRRIPLPSAIQRIAVISSENAAGYADFQAGLQQNPYGYAFYSRLFPAAMQGEAVEKEVVAQLEAIPPAEYDAIAIIRGGGARLDLAAFDNYSIAKAIAGCGLPVMSGIGHEVDTTVIDQVVHQPLKTPTAVADFIINRQLQYEARLLDYGRQIYLSAQQQLQNESRILETRQERLPWQTEQCLQRAKERLSQYETQATDLVRQIIQQRTARLDQFEQALQLLRPESVLARGYARCEKAGRPVRSLLDVEPHDTLITHLPDGAFRARVIDKD